MLNCVEHEKSFITLGPGVYKEEKSEDWPSSAIQLLQLCMARTVFLILVTVRLYTVIQEVCRLLTKEKQRKTDISLTDQ